MKLETKKLSEYIELNTNRNSELLFSTDDVRGISNTKEIMDSKARVEYAELKKFYIVRPDEFVYNPRTSRNGEKIGIVLNNTKSSLLFTFNDISFRVKKNKQNELNPNYLFLLFKRDIFDKYARYHSWGSATELFTWEDMIATEIRVPSKDVQDKIIKKFNSINNRIIKIKEEKSILYALSEELVNNFINKNREKLSLCSLVNNFACSSIKSGLPKFEGELPYFATADSDDDHLITPGEFVSWNERPSRANMYPVPNSIWFAKMKNTKKTLSFSSEENPKLILSTGFYGLKIDESYFYYYLAFINKHDFENEKNQKCNGTTQEALNDDGASQLLIPLPNEQIIKDINSKFKTIFSKIKLLNKELAQLERLHKLLIKTL